MKQAKCDTPPLCASPGMLLHRTQSGSGASVEVVLDSKVLEGEQISVTDEKRDYKDVESISDGASSTASVLRNERDIVTHVISSEDDPSMNPWTIRAFLIGIGLSAFGGVLGESVSLQTKKELTVLSTAEIYYFKPVNNLLLNMRYPL